MSLVYSTDRGRLCPKCSNPKEQCQCSKDAPAGDGRVRIERQTKGRKGKGVTLITGLPLAGNELKKLAKAMKQHCGTGGAVKDGVVEIQGDQRQVLLEFLKKRGYEAKLSGG